MKFFSSLPSSLRSKTFSKGFTFIEIIVAIAIIGVLLSALSINFNNSRLKSRNTQRLSDLQKMQFALEEYFEQYGYYPRCGGGTYISVPANASVPGSQLPGSDVCISAHPDGSFGDLGQISLLGTYLRTIPKDPLNVSKDGIFYSYCYARGFRKTSETAFSGTALPTDYIIVARLEDPTYSGQGNPPGASFGGCNKPFRNIVVGN